MKEDKEFLTIRVYKKDKERWKKILLLYKNNGKSASDLFSDMLTLIEKEIYLYRKYSVF